MTQQIFSKVKIRKGDETISLSEPLKKIKIKNDGIHNGATAFLKLHLNSYQIFSSFTRPMGWNINSMRQINKNNGQLISKYIFGVFSFLQKRNENKTTWGIIVVKLNSFVRFLEETLAWKKSFRLCLTFIKSLKLLFAQPIGPKVLSFYQNFLICIRSLVFLVQS